MGFQFQTPEHNAHYDKVYADTERRWRQVCAIDKATHIADLLGPRAAGIESVLEVGCGTGDVLATLNAQGVGRSAVGVDVIDPNMNNDHLREGRNLTFVQQKGPTLPFEDRSFDMVFASHVLEHVDDDTQVLREFRRVLSPGGIAVLQVPVDPSLLATHEDPELTTPEQRTAAFGQHDHVRMYGGDVADRFRSGGFEVEELRPESLPAEAQQRMGLIHGGRKRGSDVFWCVRSAA